MAIAFDSTSQITGSGWSSGASMTYSHTCTGSNRYLIVGVSIGDSSTGISGVTYAGVSMTQLSVVTQGASAMYLYGLVAPSTGANNVVVTLGFSSSFCHSASVSYTGVKQSGQPDSFNSGIAAGATSLAVSTTTIANNSWIVGFFANSSANTNSRTGITSRSDNPTIGRDIGDSNAPKTPAGSYTMTESAPASGNWAMVMASISPLATTNSAMMAFF